ncbi:MAG TPA: AmmeMemoRadiSam system protein B [Usitatibacteraceae bacterium]|nr:AmmeMemoRadiSam system protein B [Usitatibacteraceae bacterium]
MLATRPAAVAGSFYPGDPSTLAVEVAACLRDAVKPLPDERAPKAIIAPHAGYVYSGPIAASAYARVAPLRGKISRVVLAGPAHRVPVAGAAVPQAGAFATPLGDVPLDEEALARLRRLPFVETSDRSHALEHSLEVHLPFLQSVLGRFRLVPVVVGDVSPGEMAELLDEVWGGDETLVVVSSDLSHYLPYGAARERDRATAASILALSPRLDPQDACGAAPVNGLLEVARRRGLEVELLDLRNSGDTAGNRSQVVGYGAFMFREPEPHHA